MRVRKFTLQQATKFYIICHLSHNNICRIFVRKPTTDIVYNNNRSTLVSKGSNPWLVTR